MHEPALHQWVAGVKSETRLTDPKNEWLKDARLKDEDVAKAQALSVIAQDIGVSMAQLAIGWCLKNDDVSTVILGASKLDQLKENIKSQDVVEKLTEDVMNKIEDILDNKPKHPPF